MTKDLIIGSLVGFFVGGIAVSIGYSRTLRNKEAMKMLCNMYGNQSLQDFPIIVTNPTRRRRSNKSYNF